MKLPVVGSLLLVAIGLLVAGTAFGSADQIGRRSVTIGRTVDGRPITAVETGDLDSPDRLLVVGCIHGNECAGTAIAAHLAKIVPPRELDVWVVPNLNPDGAAAGTRTNANGVDLNRNFPWHWQPLAGAFYSGPRPLSEPESRAAADLIRTLRPRISIWFHQHLDVVDESGGNVALEHRFAALTGLRVARLTREPGSVAGWENRQLPAGTAFVVELPAGALSAASAARFARAIITVAHMLRT